MMEYTTKLVMNIFLALANSQLGRVSKGLEYALTLADDYPWRG